MMNNSVNSSTTNNSKNTQGSKWKTQKYRDHVSAYLYISPFFLLFGVFTIFPVLWAAYISFFSWNIIGTREYIGIQNYIWIFTDDPKFWQSVGNTFSIWIMSTIPQLFLALVLANVLNSRMIKGKAFFRTAVIIPNITSLVAVGIIFGSMFGFNNGLINWILLQLGFEKYDWPASYWGAQVAVAVMVIWRWMGYNALIYLAALQSIPHDLYEASTIDGATKTQQFFFITIPMIRPMILFTVIMSTIGGMQLFVEPLIFAGNSSGGAQGQVSTMVLYLFHQGFTNNSFGYASAVAWMLFLIIIIFSFFNTYLTKKINSAN
jgi:cellobiose transport system permease protein